MGQSETRANLVNIILEDESDKNLEDEEMLHLLLQHKISEDASYVQDERLTFGDRMADSIAKFAGSWTFILIFIACLLLWITVNVILVSRAFDAYPFILLNLILSCVAAIQAPVIMMSQNRQEKKDRLRSQNDYKTNLKAEIIIEDLHQKLDRLLANQDAIVQEIERLQKQEAQSAQTPGSGAGGPGA
ncbi:MAG TPA: DUF1003 domain-containing protein [Oscillospiraceae bacterium]|nr:DUF1003 domain-containing protein [Oscillospiraceae bacterium]